MGEWRADARVWRRAAGRAARARMGWRVAWRREGGGGADASTKSFDKSLNPDRPGGPIGRDDPPSRPPQEIIGGRSFDVTSDPKNIEQRNFARSIAADAKRVADRKKRQKDLTFLEEYVSEYFDIDISSPYMLMVAPVKKPEKIPAVTHVDGTGRVQTVSKNSNPVYHKLISKFYELTDVPVIINTSMNVKGEPIVNTPEQAYNMLTKTDMDYLFMQNFMVAR